MISTGFRARMVLNVTLLAVLALSVAYPRLRAGETTPVPAPAPSAPAPAVVPASYRDLCPCYDSPYKSGLYSTIVGALSTKDIKICNYSSMCLHVDGFRDTLPVYTVIQPGPAPLVIVLLGAEGKATDPLAKTWINWLADAGYNVLSFNSTLNKDFVYSSGRGVTGNIQNEAECVRDVISAFLKSPEIQGKYTHVAIVGMSYGAIQALLIGAMIKEGKTDFKVDTIKAFSPPIDMMHSAMLLDTWWNKDRFNFTLAQLYFTVAKHKPVSMCACGCPPLSETVMRAGLSASFRLPLAEIVEANDEEFCLNLLPREGAFGNRDDRTMEAGKYGFTRFLQRCTFPYWKEKLGISDFNQLNNNARLTSVLPREPDFVETFIADDDPLNSPEDFAELKKCTGCTRFTVLNGGGHLGYVNDCWTKDRLQGLFK